MKAYRQLLVHSVLSACVLSTLVGCGFQLRGSNTYNANHANTLQSAYPSLIHLKIADNRTSKSIRRPLQKQLAMLGVTTTDTAVNYQHASIEVDNLQFREYELVGVLTEVRVIILADVTYHIPNNGRIIKHTQPIQIERSYQYNEASVSVEQQGIQVKQWLYDALATRIADQYVALNRQN